MFINSNNTIVYTCSIGQTEGLNAQPQIKNSNLRHVCLTDNKNLTSDEWEIININSLFPMDQYRSQRNLKIRPQLVFPDYKYSLYLDNTVVLKATVEEFINQLLLGLIKEENEPFFILPFHSFRENLISEFYECFMNNLDTHLNFYEQLRDYIKINSIALKNKPYWTAILFRSHMHSKLIEFSEIWFSNVMRYSRRDQLSIIHSGLQSNLNLIGFELDNHSSKYHNWPILKQERRFRIIDNEQFKISSDFLSQIVKKLSLEDNQIKKINFEEEIFKNYSDDGLKNQLLKSENEILKIENKNLKKNLNSFNNSKIWRLTLFIRKLKDYLKKYLNSIYNSKIWSFTLLIIKLKDYLKKKKDLYLKPLIIFYLKLNFYLKFKDQILKIIIKIYTTYKKEEVDIVIPIHNAKDYVDKCLKSIFSSKTNFFINLIIVDDFSDLETKKTLNNLIFLYF